MIFNEQTHLLCYYLIEVNIEQYKNRRHLNRSSDMFDDEFVHCEHSMNANNRSAMIIEYSCLVDGFFLFSFFSMDLVDIEQAFRSIEYSTRENSTYEREFARMILWNSTFDFRSKVSDRKHPVLVWEQRSIRSTFNRRNEKITKIEKQNLE